MIGMMVARRLPEKQEHDNADENKCFDKRLNDRVDRISDENRRIMHHAGLAVPRESGLAAFPGLRLQPSIL